jgi:hypothetical protein
VAHPGSVWDEVDDGADVEIILEQRQSGDQQRGLVRWSVASAP